MACCLFCSSGLDCGTGILCEMDGEIHDEYETCEYADDGFLDGGE